MEKRPENTPEKQASPVSRWIPPLVACYKPLRVALNEEDQLDWSVYQAATTPDRTVLVPCRHCTGCKAGQAREWAIRCFHESQYHVTQWRDPDTQVVALVPNSCFLTLTYNDENLPENGLLYHRHFQLFLKKLLNRREESPRFFMCGEYGSLGRPHYHAILFGEQFTDRYQITTSDDQTLNCSFELDELWHYGRATIDDINFNTIRYVTGYLNKKAHANGNFTGPLAEIINNTTGEITISAISPEYRQMSRRPGLGRAWLEANLERIYPADEIVINGQTYPPPGYYDRYLKSVNPGLYRTVQSQRLDNRIQSQTEWTSQRCSSAEDIHSQRLRQERIH